MQLVSAVLGFVAKKLGTFVVVLVVLFGSYLLVYALIPSIQEVGAKREELRTVTEEQKQLRSRLDELEKQSRAAAKVRDEECGLIGKVADFLFPGAPCKAAEEALAAVDAEQKRVAGRLAQANTEAAGLRSSQASGLGWVVNKWNESWRWLLGLAAIVLFLPPVLRILNYFVLMPLLRWAHKPIQLSADSDDSGGRLEPGAALRTLPVAVPPGEVLFARSEHVRPVRGTTRGQLLYDWSSPFVSFAAGLYGLTRIKGDEETEATLAPPNDPDSYLMRIDFTDHPGLVMRPRHVVGVMGSPSLSTRWRWGLQALATWQVRYILFSGTGSLIVQGTGDVAASVPGSRSMRMDQNLLMGFDSRLVYGVDRTEVFWPYLWGKKPLVDDEFTGDHPIFWQKSSADGPSNPIARVFNTITSALGKLLGF